MKSNKSGMERKESFKQENISYTSKMDYSVAQKLTTTGQSNLETMSQLHGKKAFVIKYNCTLSEKTNCDTNVYKLFFRYHC